MTKEVNLECQRTFANLDKSTALLGQQIEQNTVITREILSIVKGSNGEGLVTRAALNKASISRAWWWLGSISLALLGIFVWLIKKGA